MSISGRFPSTAGPDDPTPLLTPQQYQYAIQQYLQQQQQPQSQAPPPPPPPPPRPTPVIDPRLQTIDSNATAQRLDALEHQVEEMKSQKRANSDENDSTSKRRRKGRKPSAYILKGAKGLTAEQLRVRGQLMRKIKNELSTLTGMTKEADSDESDSSASPPPPTRPLMTFKFSANVDHPTNVKIFARAADLIWKEQHDSAAATFSLAHKDVKFSLEDLLEFGKTNFRSWKRTWKVDKDPASAAKHKQQESRNRQLMRKKDMKQNRLKAIPAYKKKYNKDPVCILETDWMSDEISAPDTDDEQERNAHRRRLVAAAPPPPNQPDQAIWELVRPGFQTTEVTTIKDELDGLRAEQKSGQKKRSRPSVPRINLGNFHLRPPTGTIYPFMVSQDWYDEHVKDDSDAENAFAVYTKNPVGFGEQGNDGYTGDDEGTSTV
ncbi:hypothetical protein DFH09DRAFT_1317551 [Mycena vulgaris]|nr:hypothetical protein DFH09DRAFT_1317551 [Mycena vulgaris]